MKFGSTVCTTKHEIVASVALKSRIAHRFVRPEATPTMNSTKSFNTTSSEFRSSYTIDTWGANPVLSQFVYEATNHPKTARIQKEP